MSGTIVSSGAAVLGILTAIIVARWRRNRTPTIDGIPLIDEYLQNMGGRPSNLRVTIPACQKPAIATPVEDSQKN